MNIQQMTQAMGSPTPSGATPPTGGMTLEQMNQIMNGGQSSPDNAAAALGHSNGLLGNIISGAKSISTGVAKSELGAVTGLGTLTAEAGSMLPGQAGQFFAGGAQKGQEIMASPAVQPQGIGEAVGKTAGDIGQFFVPGGAEKGIVAKGAEYLGKLPDLLGLTGKAAGALTGTLKTALQSAVSGFSMGGVTAAQTGDLGKAKGAVELGAGAGTAGGILEHFGPEISNALNKADFRLSPSQEAKTTKIADSAASFITKNKILGRDATKFQKLQVVNNNLESALQNSLPKELAVPKNEIVDEINKSVETLRSTDPAVYNQARSRADEAIKLLQEQKTVDPFTKGGAVSVKDTLQGKRSWASMAFKTAKKGKIDPTVSNEGAYAVEQAYQKALENTLQRTDTTIKVPTSLQKYFDGAKDVSLQDFNKVYSDAINAKNLTGIAQYKNDAGLFGRLFGLWVGKSVGQAIAPGLMGEIVGAGIGEAASTHIPGAARNIMERGLAVPGATVTGAAKVGQAIENQ